MHRSGSRSVGAPVGRYRAIELVGAPALSWFAGCSMREPGSGAPGTDAEKTGTPPPAE